ncbi:MAG: radical SAM protein [Kiritimatiellia bacterium]|jgi:uncharacterized protein|nr:radical SAM protein [Kiritimatiellia bacterium]MDP6847823.1 radical SAM protein [Kiritimatiellia bacterium]
MDVTLSLTHDCNLACSYCYAGEKRRTSMTTKVADRALDFAFSFDADEVQLGYFGGEPMMEWELLQHATARAEELAADSIKLKKTLTTNVTMMTPERAEWLKEHEFYLGVSIDGCRKMHDVTRPFVSGRSSFDACIKGLDIILSLIPDLEVIVVPDPMSVQHLAESIRFMIEDKKVHRVSVNPNFYTEWDDEALDGMKKAFEEIGEQYLAWYRSGMMPQVNFIDTKVITQLKEGYSCKDKCNFGEHEIAVAPSGRLYPCERLVATDDGGEMCIGNIFDGFDEKKRAAILSQRGNVNPDCLSCSIRSRCMNWCCCINYALTGTINRTDGIVCFHEQTAAAVADRIGSMLFEERCPAFLRRFYYEDFSDPNPDTTIPSPTQTPLP